MTSLLPPGGLRSAQRHAGETLDVPERIIVAPASGVFHPVPPLDVSAEGARVEAGQTIGTLHGPNATTPVTSPFDGYLMGMLATPGERLRAGEPVAWLREA